MGTQNQNNVYSTILVLNQRRIDAAQTLCARLGEYSKIPTKHYIRPYQLCI